MPTATSDAAGRPDSAVEATVAPRDGWRVTGVVLAAGLIAICVVLGLAASLTPRTLQELGIPDAGQLTTLGKPVVKVIFDLSSALTVGWLIAAVILAPPQKNGIFDVGGYRSIRAASVSAWVWTASALALVPFSISDTSGYPLGKVLRADALQAGIDVIESARHALIAAVFAALVAVLCRISMRPASAAALLILALAGLVPVALSGHNSQAESHDIATDTMLFHLGGMAVWIGGLVAFLGLARQRAAHLDVIARRYSAIALIAYIAVALSGIGNALVRFYYLSDLWTTQYGLLIITKTVLLGILGVFGFYQRRKSVTAIATNGDRASILRLSVFEIGFMAATIGVAVALARTASPSQPPIAFTDVSRVLGYDLVGPGSAWQWLTVWRFDFLFGTLAIVLAALYLVGVYRLKKRGDSWKTSRTVAWLCGCFALLIATSSGVGAYAEAQFSVHMLAHMILGMGAPILLVLGGPTTLALRVLPVGPKGVPGAREAIVGLMHSRVLRWLTHPLVVFVLFIGSFFAIYFTPLFDVMVESHIGHVIMTAHFLIVGYLYYWVIIGVDPSPRRLAPMFKLGLLLGALPFHAFFGLALMNSKSIVGANYYQTIAAPWVPNLLSDQRLGGAIAWGGSELPLIIVIIALLSQWSKSDAREAGRSDRKTDRMVAANAAGAAQTDGDEEFVQARDDELDAYNAMLGQLAERDKRTPR
ncbi:copper resistance protein CopD [Nakamurella silvestris]|nr:copper resistance protein CopD [Nakamurella silvestris]